MIFGQFIQIDSSAYEIQSARRCPLAIIQSYFAGSLLIVENTYLMLQVIDLVIFDLFFLIIKLVISVSVVMAYCLIIVLLTEFLG